MMAPSTFSLTQTVGDGELARPLRTRSPADCDGALCALAIGWRRIEPFALARQRTTLADRSWFASGNPVQVVLCLRADSALYRAQPGSGVRYVDPLEDGVTPISTSSLSALAAAVDATAAATRATLLWCGFCRPLAPRQEASAGLCRACTDLGSGSIR